MFKKNIIVLIVIINVVINLCGCSLIKDEKKYEKEMTDKMIKHMYEKYGEFDYEIVGFSEPCRGGLYDRSYKYDTLELEVVINDMERTIIVERREKKRGYEFYDNYFGYIIVGELENYIKEMADKHFQKTKVSCYFPKKSFFPSNLTKDSKVNDLLKEDKKDCELELVIYLDMSGKTLAEFENNVHSFMKEYEETDIQTDISIYGCEAEIIDAMQDEDIGKENIKYRYEDTINKKETSKKKDD